MTSLASIRNPGCTLCPMSEDADVRCWTAQGDVVKPEVLVVVRHVPSESRREAVNDLLEEAGFTRAAFTSVVKCRNFTKEPTKSDHKTCADRYLSREIEAVDPDIVLVMGNEALHTVLGLSGIMKYRGREFYNSEGRSIVPTISYAAAARNPRQLPGLKADLKFAARLSFDEDPETPKPKLFVANTRDKLRKLKVLLDQAHELAYDVETTGADEFHPDGAIISLALGGVTRSGREFCAVVPLYHSESPLRKAWSSVLKWLDPAFRSADILIAHNGKFDSRWLRQYGVRSRVDFDTMLAIHTLNEEDPKSLKISGRSHLGVDPWDIETKDLLNEPLNKVLTYNALDAWYTWHLYKKLDEQLKNKSTLSRLFTLVMMPANHEYIAAERRGIWIDQSRLATSLHRFHSDLQDVEEEILEHVPDPQAPGWPVDSKGRLRDINFNPSNFLRWLLFEHLELPVLGRGKPKEDGSPGDPSVAEKVMLNLRGHHPIIDLLMKRSVIVKYLQFLTSYDQNMDHRGRIHTSFKLYGTVTGRTSSGKSGDEKLVGNALAKRRGVNIQQVPRDSAVRGVFGAPPGWAFVSADYSQVELRVAAFLSREENMISIYQRGEDIHMATACSILGKSPSEVTKEQRKGAKAVNFGFLYGMSWRKFIETALEKYDLVYTEEEAKAVRSLYFRTYPGLLPWHRRQRAIVRKHKRVVSPLGRVRHLRDIDSMDRGVQAEAERQAINSPVQSFASDLTLLAMTRIARELRRKKIKSYVIGTVHDEINFEIRRDHVAQALPIIKHTMENLPLEDMFGLHIDVPMRCDVEVSAFWGRGVELEDHQVLGWTDDLYDELIVRQREETT